MTEHPEWVTFINYIRPSYTLPSRHIISNRLLDEEYREIKDKVKSMIEEAHTVGLQCDGWTNIR